LSIHGPCTAGGCGCGGCAQAGKNDSVTVFDLSTFAKNAEIQTGQNPDAICYEPKTAARVHLQRPFRRLHRD
jgi:hypothetical protein